MPGRVENPTGNKDRIAHVTPITYEISSIASGKIGVATFTNASVEGLNLIDGDPALL
jgi:hypothetical protein